MLPLFLLLVGCPQPGPDPDLQDGELIESAKIDDVGSVDVYRVRYGSDGWEVDGMVAIPESGGPFPVLIYNHGGFAGLWPTARSTTPSSPPTRPATAWRSSHRPTAARTTARVASSSAAARSHDAINLIPVAADWPEVDASRVVAMGNSHGGCVSLRMTEYTDDLTGVVAVAAPSELDDLVEWHAGQGNHETARTWSDYLNGDGQEHSPLYGDLEGPMLLLHGTEDATVPFEQACMLKDALDGDLDVGSYRRVGEAWIAGDTGDCQGMADSGEPEYDPALEGSGAVFVGIEGAEHVLEDEDWEIAWEQVEEWLDVDMR